MNTTDTDSPLYGLLWGQLGRNSLLTPNRGCDNGTLWSTVSTLRKAIWKETDIEYLKEVTVFVQQNI